MIGQAQSAKPCLRAQADRNHRHSAAQLGIELLLEACHEVTVEFHSGAALELGPVIHCLLDYGRFTR
jgi:hypothetical protein